MSESATLPRYEVYKDSGIDWLGEIPDGWETKKIKFLFKIGRGRVISKEKLDDNEKYPVYSSQTENNGVLGYISSYDFEGDLITWTTDGANAGTVFLRKGKFNCTNVCGTLKILKPDKNNLIFLSNALSIAAQFYKRPDTNGAKIMNGEMANIYVPLPPLNQQISIANYLEKKLLKIDETITIKEKQIELLKERKQILIQNAVTRGLDPNVPMKDSGVDWIGDIPEHWKCKRLKYIVKILKRIIGFEGPDVLSITQKGIVVKDIESGEGQLAMDYSKYQILNPGEFAMNHMDLLTGYVDISKYEGVVSPDYRVFTNTSEEMTDAYLLLIFQLGYKQRVFYKYGQGVSLLGRWRFPADNFNNFFVPIPTEKEQEVIVKHIMIESQKIDKAIQLLEEQIDKQKEYKSTLINSAVTGKIKVPGVKG